MSTPEDAVTAIAAATARERILIAAHTGDRMEAGDQVAALLDLCRTLAAGSIPYAVIGGIAVGIHSATPRATNDVDVAVPSGVSRARVTDALSAAGFLPGGEFAHSLNFRHPGGEPVQVAFDEGFDLMIERAEIVEVGGVQIRIVTRADLVVMKERAAADPARRKSKSLRDQADVELLRGDVPDPDEGW